MAHEIHMIMDFQYGSTGKGLIAGYLAKRTEYDTAICAFATNAGHTYIDGDLHVMTQQIPTAAIVCPSIRNVLIGPGAAIHIPTFMAEYIRYFEYLKNKTFLIHPQAAIVEDYHSTQEMADGRTKMGSTGKGVGEAYIERMRRYPDGRANTAGIRIPRDYPSMSVFVCHEYEYMAALQRAETVIIEGAQGYSLSMYHGQYPYTTSRDVTSWQVAADCGLPFCWAPYIKMIGTARVMPIRVNNRDGSSGPCYPDQQELSWSQLGIEPELTTVTKLPRRIFSFSAQQITEAVFHCGAYYDSADIFLNFANYLDKETVEEIITAIETPREFAWNAPKVKWVGTGPEDKHVLTRSEYVQHHQGNRDADHNR